MKMSKRFTTISAVILASSALALGTVASSVSTVSAQDFTVIGKKVFPDGASIPIFSHGTPFVDSHPWVPQIFTAEGGWQKGYSGSNGVIIGLRGDGKPDQLVNLNDANEVALFRDGGINLDVQDLKARIDKANGLVAPAAGTNAPISATVTATNGSTTPAPAAQAGKANGKKDASETAKPASKPVAAAATAKADKALPKTSAVK